MEIDVGQTVEPLELPEHLKDHTYCVYNPTVCNVVRPSTERTGTIPVERLSYAPEVPDSPRTLFKLLKVLPKKGGSTSGGRSQGRSQGKMGGVTNVKGYISKTVGSRKRKSILGGRKSRIGDSGDESFGSGTPDVSDGEGESGSTRRRSQRNKGQRKHYVDDIKLSLSDEETLEDIMLPPPKKTGYFSMMQPDDDESDYDDSVSSGTPISKMLKYKKSITINPTEGFQYSDIYMDAPAEEAQVVEKILSHRVRPSELTGDDIEEFFVKYKNYSYLHVEWATSDKLTKGDKRFEGKAKRYKSKLKTLGLFANVDDEPFNPDFTVADRILDIATHVETNGEKVTHYLVKWKSLPYEDSTWELEEDLDKEVISNFLEFSTMPPDEELQYIRRFPPNKFKPIKESKEYKGSNKLRPYQLEGLNWLLFNWYTRQNCILADEMGLGKTVQSIAFILEIVSVGIRGPFLVIAPLSTISNWQREFETWSNLNVVIYHGSAYSRRMIHEYELYYRDLAGKIIIDAYKFNVLVTTYEVLLSDNSELQNILWRVVVIDEAHRLKNKNCKMLEGLRELRMEHRVLLTGTPLQNNVEELFSLLNFLEPSQFPSPQAFIQQFGDLKTEEEVDELKAVLKPMMLRRLKEDVEKSLAPKEETIIEIEMTSIQKQYYRAILERNFSFLSRGSSVPNLLNTMMELRKCCNHPFLIAGAESKIVDDFKIHYPNKNVFESLIQASGKLVLVDKLLPKLKEKGHKVLIFSQMVKCLDILEDYMRMKGHLYERIDGQVRGTLRQSAIDRFTKPEYERFVFLLCTRAGGLGINLTAADTVIIYDSDWNPQNDIQAQARCHRIGQNKMVKVYRLITTHSYEREMFDRASLKLGLDKAVLQSMNTQQQANGPPQLSKQEIENLLKKGAYGAIMDSDDAANQFCEEDIELILERRTQVIQLESEGKGSTFSKASFVVDGTTDISVNDPDFWKKWAQKANLNLDQLARKDTLVMDEPRVRRQVRRYGEEMLETIIDSMDHIEDILPSRGRKGWTKLECFKTEKALLIYGWGQWDDILNYSKFKKRQLTIRDTENISRTMLVYCLNHFNGDEKVQLYIHQLIDPSVTTEDTQKSSGFYTGFTEDDYLALMAKDPETLFQEESYMKHLRRHATRILLRVRQLHMIRWQIMKPYMSQITSDSLARDLKFTPPRPEEEPPASWWDELCDTSLLVAIVKHGYEQFKLWRADKCLCFWELVGEQQLSFHQATPSSSKKKKKYREEEIDLEAELEEGEDYSDDGYSNSTTPSTSSHRLITTIRKTRAATAALMTTPSNSSLIDYQVGPYVWPSLAEINTRARRLVNSYLKQQKRLEMKQAQLMKVRNNSNS
jgi:SNF2 family DNA or RNA helicase